MQNPILTVTEINPNNRGVREAEAQMLCWTFSLFSNSLSHFGKFKVLWISVNGPRICFVFGPGWKIGVRLHLVVRESATFDTEICPILLGPAKWVIVSGQLELDSFS
jgi:hypothetical protein